MPLIKHKVPKPTLVQDDCICDVCGISNAAFKEENGHNLEFATLEAHWGYYSDGKDMTRHCAYICEPCYDRLVAQFKINVLVRECSCFMGGGDEDMFYTRDEYERVKGSQDVARTIPVGGHVANWGIKGGPHGGVRSNAKDSSAEAEAVFLTIQDSDNKIWGYLIQDDSENGASLLKIRAMEPSEMESVEFGLDFSYAMPALEDLMRADTPQLIKSVCFETEGHYLSIKFDDGRSVGIWSRNAEENHLSVFVQSAEGEEEDE